MAFVRSTTKRKEFKNWNEWMVNLDAGGDVGLTKVQKNDNRISAGVNPTKLFFIVKQRFFPFFAIKIGNFKEQTIFSQATNTQT